jgi:site-specific DNA-cytosine methylase
VLTPVPIVAIFASVGANCIGAQTAHGPGGGFRACMTVDIEPASAAILTSNPNHFKGTTHLTVDLASPPDVNSLVALLNTSGALVEADFLVACVDAPCQPTSSLTLMGTKSRSSTTAQRHVDQQQATSNVMCLLFSSGGLRKPFTVVILENNPAFFEARPCHSILDGTHHPGNP